MQNQQLQLPFRIPIVDIERTPEYEDFMRKLDEFHRPRGTENYTREPTLGGMRIDLWKLSELVRLHGGFERVTADRAWKKISGYFDFPPTCTNSAFVLKRIYQHTLRDFIMKVWCSGILLVLVLKRFDCRKR